MNKKLEDLNLGELKALAYDQIAQIDTAQYNLKIINERITVLSQESPVAQETVEIPQREEAEE